MLEEERANFGRNDQRDVTGPSSVPPVLDRLVGNVRALEEWYSSTFRRRIVELTELLSTQISENLRSQYDQEYKIQVERVNSQWEASTASLKKEIESLQQNQQSQPTQSSQPIQAGIEVADGTEEIARIEKRIGEIEMELEHSFTADSVPLSQLLQLRTTQTELKSYLRGLKFLSPKSAAEIKIDAESAHRLRQG